MKLSIAMCTYNGAAYLPEQLESLAAQTRLPNELVVCDDRSNDGRTREIVKAFAKKVQFPVRLFVNRENLGSKKNFEKAIRRCRGDIIFLCDQDDVWKPNKLARIEAAFAMDSDVGLVFTDAEVVDENLQTMVDSLWECVGFPIERLELIKHGRVFHALLPDNAIPGATMAFRSRLMRFALPIPSDTILQHDGWLALIIAAVARVAFLDEPLIKYRQHSQQQIGVSIKGSKYERRDDRIMNPIPQFPHPPGKIDALKTAYARLVTKCSHLVRGEDLKDIQAWITRLENEKAVLENDAAPSEARKPWEDMQQYLDSRIIRVAPYILKDLWRIGRRLRPRDLQGAARAIRSDRRQGINESDNTRKD